MKNLFLFGLAIILFTSCQEKQEQRYFAESPEIDILKKGIKAYEKADWDTWRGHFADTAKIYVNSKDPMTLDERVNGLKETSSAFSSYGFDKNDEFIEMVIDKKKEKWVYYWAQHNATLSANSKKLSMPVHLAVQFADGKIVTEHVYFDATEMNKAFGELTAAAEPEME